MSTIPDQFPLSLKAWPKEKDKASALSSLISRINVERGSFRTVTEESLREEIAKAEAGQELNEDGESEGEPEEEEPDRIKELVSAREEMLGQLDLAHHASMVALDFVSLLLSKDTPVQAGLSISAALRDAVSLGTLGADKVRDSRVTDNQKRENAQVMKGWKIGSINRGVDTILASASRLEREMEMETKYWEEILAVDEKGWAICKLPQEKHTLGVRFGFVEAAPAFRNRSLVALRRNTDGRLFLDQGVSDPTPKRLRVRIESDGVITGELSRPSLVPDDAPTNLVILQARDTIFEEELWQELNREARVLANHGVRSIGGEIRYKMTPTRLILLDLVPISDEHAEVNAQVDDKIAEIVSFSLHLLLLYAHRQNLNRRSQLPLPVSNRPPQNVPYALLRPIITRLHHESSVLALTTLLGSLGQTLGAAGLQDASYTWINHLSRITPPGQTKSIPELTIESLITHLEAEFSVPLSNTPQSLTIRLRTTMIPLETRFLITAIGPVNDSCKPPPNPSSVEEVKTYILWASGCALALSFAGSSHANTPSDQEGPQETYPSQSIHSGTAGWHRTHNPTVLRKSFKNEVISKEISFRVASLDATGTNVQLKVKYKAVGSTGDKETKIPSEYIFHSTDSVGGKTSVEEIVNTVGKWTGPLRKEGEDGLPPNEGWDQRVEISSVEL